MVTHISHSPQDTEALGLAWAAGAAPGWIITLSGDLGAGKTQLVRGLARGLGSSARVHSPTFTLVNEYGGGRLKLFHLDLYRLETAEQIYGAGVEEFLQTDGVVVIEWAERLPAAVNHNLNGRRVFLEVLSETARRITYEDIGA